MYENEKNAAWSRDHKKEVVLAVFNPHYNLIKQHRINTFQDFPFDQLQNHLQDLIINMQLPTTLSLLALLAIPFASADCYSGGQEASQSVRDTMSADAQLDGVCSALIGTYTGGERRSTCVEVGGAKYDFMLHYHESGTRDIYLSECKDGFRKQISCAHGGKTSYGNWEYRADYNAGVCTDPVKRDFGVAFNA